MCCRSSRMVYHIYPIWLVLWWAATVATPWVKWISAQEVGGNPGGNGMTNGGVCTPLQQCLAILMDLMAIAAMDQKYWFSNLECYISIHFDTLRSHVKKPLFMIAPFCFATSGAMRATSEALVSSSGFPLWESGSQRQCFSASTQWYAVTSEIHWNPMDANARLPFGEENQDIISSKLTRGVCELLSSK